jgi:SAM-dependent MidA family methyltransferase
MSVERRREAAASDQHITGSGNTELAEWIRADIQNNGPITFARFMERALYDPVHGYYVSTTERPTRSGDFLTAPELHPIFGRTLAVQVEEMWQRLGAPPEFVLHEYGAGSGALFVSILDGLVRSGSPLADSIRYEPVDFARQRAAIAERLGSLGRAAQLVGISEHSDAKTGLVIANEYVDALPVHRVIQMDGVLREIHVAWRDDAFVEVAGPPTDDRLETWFSDAAVELAEGQRAEVNLALLDWIAQIAADLERGYVLVIDYGAAARELYGPTRPNGTIRAFGGHMVSSDVLSGVGERDITSHVDFDALERQAVASGFDVAGRRRSNEFLLACGLEDAYQEARAEAASDWEGSTALRSAVQRLVDPNALGGYLVDVLARNAPIEPPLRGFSALPGTR